MSLKAFDLVPIIEKVTVDHNGSSFQALIESLECCGTNIFVGTSDSFIIRYILEEKLVENTDCVLISNRRKEMTPVTNLKKPILQLKAVSALDRLICLCDNILFILNISNLKIISPLSKLKGVLHFCVNENPLNSNPFSIEICIAKRKTVQLCLLTEDRLTTARDISIPESPLTMAIDGQFACIAMSSNYAVVNCETGDIQPLCDHNGSQYVPIVQRITKEQFLLNGPGALGIFVTAAGISERPPLLWGENVISVAYSHPYILTLRTDNIVIYSILDQQEKQRVVFYGGAKLGNFDGRIIVASPDTVCALVPVPWQRQVDGLLNDKRVDDALELLQYVNKTNISAAEFKQVFNTIQQRCGFIKLFSFEFEDARHLFREGQLDVRELISLFPSLLSSRSTFVKSNPPLHNAPNIEVLCPAQSGMFQECKMFLRNYLEEVRPNTGVVHLLDLDTALLKLYAESHDKVLLTFVNTAICDVKEVEEILIRSKCHHALALHYDKVGQTERALQIWEKILSQNYQDPDFPGLPFLVSFLASLQDQNLVWKYAKVVLDLDEELGIKIFTDRRELFSSNCENGMKPDAVVQFLQRYPLATFKFLEDLVFQKKLEKEKFHTHLAMLYLDQIVKLTKETPIDEIRLKASRQQLQHMLQFSNSYRVQLLLGKALENKLHHECAFLYGKLENHEKALRILVHTLSDYEAAEQYCTQLSEGRDIKYRQKLFHTLLCLYLDPEQDVKSQEELLTPAIKLLNNSTVDFDPAKVLKLLPQKWSIAVVEKFLLRSLMNTSHQCRSTKIQRALMRQQTIQTQFAQLHYSTGCMHLNEERLCSVCKKPFTESSFAWYPNNTVTHEHCASKAATSPVSSKTGSKEDCNR